ncbi:hypothetical protein LIA77_07828 [Sarocladium implicatum]|nr:hypothetical protein LIA77_07828 [Sarocladium implicatum]
MTSHDAGSDTTEQTPWFLRYKFPVDFPAHDALAKPQAEFEAVILKDILSRFDDADAVDEKMADEADMCDITTLVTDSTTADLRQDLVAMKMDAEVSKDEDAKISSSVPREKRTFLQLLHEFDERKSKMAAAAATTAPDMTNKTFTTNGDITNASTMDSLVDLFAELEDTISGPRLQDLLQSAWQQDPLMTLKIIFNARSIHLGKSSRITFYRCAGWLAQNHPATLVVNLKWLARPVIEKKGKKDPEDEDMVVIDEPKDADDPLRFDVKNGVAHGYWKDLLNMLALAANGELTVLGEPGKILNPVNPSFFTQGMKRKRTEGEGPTAAGKKQQSLKSGNSEEELAARKMFKEREKVSKNDRRESTHDVVVEKFKADSVYRALHLTVARLFADQLELDLAALRGNDAKAKRNISLCGKWSPSHDRFHDRQTFIVSSIAELLHPRDSFDHKLSASDSRETYLRYAREEYRKDISALRKHLDVVERKISAKDIKSIKYERLPSKAMQNYAPLFIEHDFERFEKYLEQVAQGKSRISGATLLPSVLVSRVRGMYLPDEDRLKRLPPDAIVKEKMKAMEAKVADGQWNALVQRIKDSGTLSSCIAVADVSGSMTYPDFADGTTPMDSSIALSLLVAEVADKPYRGSFISFDSNPQALDIYSEGTSFADKVRAIETSPWGGSTNFVSVFEDLLLPMAIENKLRPDEMVKRIFVFSDMQFNDANGGRYSEDRYKSGYERIKKKYEEAGYEIPELVFWNLAGGQHDNGGGKPVTVDDAGTALVSGYSQGMLKVFLDSGSFENVEEEEGDEEEEEEDMVVEKGEDGEVTVKEQKREKKTDPLKTAKKAVGHKAYDMLTVLD